MKYFFVLAYGFMSLASLDVKAESIKLIVGAELVKCLASQPICGPLNPPESEISIEMEVFPSDGSSDGEWTKDLPAPSIFSRVRLAVSKSASDNWQIGVMFTDRATRIEGVATVSFFSGALENLNQLWAIENWTSVAGNIYIPIVTIRPVGSAAKSFFWQPRSAPRARNP